MDGTLEPARLTAEKSHATAGPVSNIVSAQEERRTTTEDKKPASPEAPATPTTLSVNEDVAEDPDEELTPVTPKKESEQQQTPPKGPQVVHTPSGKKRTPFKYHPGKVTLRFIFANRDGVSVTLDCEPADTVGEVKGALMSVWPKELPDCSGGDQLRLICMGKGLLMPDSRTLEDCQVPVFKTHPTPVNVSVKPETPSAEKKEKVRHGGDGASNSNDRSNNTVDQGCSCVIF